MSKQLGKGPKGGVPPWKEGEEIDLRVIHWSLWGPRVSGLYETVRELVDAEMKIPGVLPSLCTLPSPTAPKAEQARHIQGGIVDPMHPQTRTQEWGYAMKHGDIHVIHFSFDQRLAKLKPKAVMMHGTPDAVLASALKEKDDAKSLLSASEWVNNFSATFVTSRRAKQFWEVFDPTGGKKIHLVNKGIDLDWWDRTATVQDLPGDPSVLFGEVWRGIKHPMHLLYAMNILYERNPEVRLNTWALNKYRDFWEHMIGAAQFWKFIGREKLGGINDYPEHFYSRGDALVSPVQAGDVSRVGQEAMACGCPVISWDSDPFGDNHAYKLAKPFDIDDLANKIEETCNEVHDDREGVARKCRNIAEKYYDINEEAKSIVKVLREVVNES
jgi:glycosyltransferase involved in cell wall biosynthesis